MLVLSRKPGQRILIGPNVEVTVSAIRGNQVKIAIECPRYIRVLREELQWSMRGLHTADAELDANSRFHPESA